MTRYTTLVGDVVQVDRDTIAMELSDPDSSKVTQLSIPRRVCRNGDQITVGDTQVEVLDSWFRQQDVL